MAFGDQVSEVNLGSSVSNARGLLVTETRIFVPGKSDGVLNVFTREGVLQSDENVTITNTRTPRDLVLYNNTFFVIEQFSNDRIETYSTTGTSGVSIILALSTNSSFTDINGITVIGSNTLVAITDSRGELTFFTLPDTITSTNNRLIRTSSVSISGGVSLRFRSLASNSTTIFAGQTLGQDSVYLFDHSGTRQSKSINIESDSTIFGLSATETSLFVLEKAIISPLFMREYTLQGGTPLGLGGNTHDKIFIGNGTSTPIEPNALFLGNDTTSPVLLYEG